MVGIEEEIVAVRAEVLKENEGKEGGEARRGGETKGFGGRERVTVGGKACKGRRGGRKTRVQGKRGLRREVGGDRDGISKALAGGDLLEVERRNEKEENIMTEAESKGERIS